jgi:hypothetical protein
MKQDYFKKFFKKAPSVIKILWISLFIIPLTCLTILIVIMQLQSIQIDGKGDSGHERSISHPFICISQHNFTSSGSNYYCDYKEFFTTTPKKIAGVFIMTGLTTVYFWILIFLIPLTITIFYLKQKKFHDIS